VEKAFKEMLKKALPHWPYYRTIKNDSESSPKQEDNSGGRRKSRTR